MNLTPQGISGNLFAYHPKPLRDELLTSWIMRIAHGNGLKVHPFVTLNFGRGDHIWNRDFDKCAPDTFIQAIANFTGTTFARAFQTTLRSYEGVLYESHNPFGNTQWLLPLGVYHRTRRRYGLQFCPLCLASDIEPYYRRSWRLAFYTVCDVHRIHLHDRCPECKAPVSFFRTELGHRNWRPGATLKNCHNCNRDLTLAPVKHFNWPSWEQIVNYQSLLNWFDLGWNFTTGSTLNYSHLYFAGLHQLCKLFLMRGRSHSLNRFQLRVQSETNINWFGEDCGRPYETQQWDVRHAIIGNATWLTAEWPSRFIDLAKDTGLRYSDALRDLPTKPFWFINPIEAYLKQPNYYS